MFRKLIGLAAVLLLLQGGVVQGEIISLMSRGAYGWINGALFWSPQEEVGSGTGIFQPFLRIHQNSTEKGFNTDAKPQYDEDGAWTTSLLLSAVPHKSFGGIDYLQFCLDINEEKDDVKPQLSLEELQIFASADPNLTGYNETTRKLAGLSAIYDLDRPSDNSIQLNFKLFPGSGYEDMIVIIPSSLFTGLAPASTYLNLFSRFGVPDTDWDSGDGFEEWAVLTNDVTIQPPPDVEPRPNSVPEPGSMVLLLGLLLTGGGIGALRRRR